MRGGRVICQVNQPLSYSLHSQHSFLELWTIDLSNRPPCFLLPNRWVSPVMGGDCFSVVCHICRRSWHQLFSAMQMHTEEAHHWICLLLQSQLKFQLHQWWMTKLSYQVSWSSSRPQSHDFATCCSTSPALHFLHTGALDKLTSQAWQKDTDLSHLHKLSSTPASYTARYPRG